MTLATIIAVEVWVGLKLPLDELGSDIARYDPPAEYKIESFHESRCHVKPVLVTLDMLSWTLRSAEASKSNEFNAAVTSGVSENGVENDILCELLGCGSCHERRLRVLKKPDLYSELLEG
jgi:hypothetical protein